MRNPDSSSLLDAAVIGGGPAGLQAALTLGRMHLRAVLFDSGQYRNGTVAHAHNLLTHDGRPPGELRELARAEIGAYETVTVRDDEVTSVRQEDEGFAIEVAGGEVVRVRAVVLATGMRDELPGIPGLEEAWGREAVQCPFCHGHEFAGRDIALVGEDAHAETLAAMLERIAASVELVPPFALRSVERIDDGLRLTLAEDETREVSGLFISGRQVQRAPFAEELGCRILPSGCVEIDPFGCTSVPGVYAAGDMAHIPEQPAPMVSLAVAIAAGQMAGASCVRQLTQADLKARG